MENEASRSEADKDDADCKIYLPMKDKPDITRMAMMNWWDPDILKEMLKPNTRVSDVARKYDDPTFIMMKNGENVGKVIGANKD
ncbi:unnamed protein product [Camellia sinensis]